MGIAGRCLFKTRTQHHKMVGKTTKLSLAKNPTLSKREAILCRKNARGAPKLALRSHAGAPAGALGGAPWETRNARGVRRNGHQGATRTPMSAPTRDTLSCRWRLPMSTGASATCPALYLPVLWVDRFRLCAPRLGRRNRPVVAAFSTSGLGLAKERPLYARWAMTPDHMLHTIRIATKRRATSRWR